MVAADAIREYLNFCGFTRGALFRPRKRKSAAKLADNAATDVRDQGQPMGTRRSQGIHQRGLLCPRERRALHLPHRVDGFLPQQSFFNKQALQGFGAQRRI